MAELKIRRGLWADGSGDTKQGRSPLVELASLPPNIGDDMQSVLVCADILVPRVTDLPHERRMVLEELKSGSLGTQTRDTRTQTRYTQVGCMAFDGAGDKALTNSRSIDHELAQASA